MNDSARMCQMLDVPEEDERGQRERRRHLDVLRAEQQPPAIVAIGDDAADEREEQDRQLAEEVVEPEVERGLREVEDEPALRDLLHPRADGRGEGAEPEHPEIAIGECGERAVQERRSEGAEASADRAADAFVSSGVDTESLILTVHPSNTYTDGTTAA